MQQERSIRNDQVQITQKNTSQTPLSQGIQGLVGPPNQQFVKKGENKNLTKNMDNR
jgi:hypothetical protein